MGMESLVSNAKIRRISIVFRMERSDDFTTIQIASIALPCVSRAPKTIVIRIDLIQRKALECSFAECAPNVQTHQN